MHVLYILLSIGNWTFRIWNIFFTKNVLVFVLTHLESLSKNRTIVKSSRTMGGFEIFQNRTIAKSVLIETVLWGDSLYFTSYTLSSWLSCRGRFKLSKIAIIHLILVGSLKFQHIWLQGEILHWFLPKNIKSDHLTKIDQRNKIFNKKNFFTKETFTWKKLFKETNFSTKKTFWQWNKLFVKTTFSMQQTF